MRRYKATGPIPEANVGDEFEADYPAAVEADLITRGRIELLPRTYKVTGPRAVRDTEPGGTFEHAFPLGQEEALVSGGHIKPVERRAKTPEPQKKEE